MAACFALVLGHLEHTKTEYIYICRIFFFGTNTQGAIHQQHPNSRHEAFLYSFFHIFFLHVAHAKCVCKHNYRECHPDDRVVVVMADNLLRHAKDATHTPIEMKATIKGGCVTPQQCGNLSFLWEKTARKGVFLSLVTAQQMFARWRRLHFAIVMDDTRVWLVFLSLIWEYTKETALNARYSLTMMKWFRKYCGSDANLRDNLLLKTLRIVNHYVMCKRQIFVPMVILLS